MKRPKTKYEIAMQETTDNLVRWQRKLGMAEFRREIEMAFYNGYCFGKQEAKDNGDGSQSLQA
jgi:hypothetical protein